jgi:putative tricarboxylic transport membrane protein
MTAGITRRDTLGLMTLGASAAAIIAAPSVVHAASYPSRPIVMVNPYAPGGYVDNIGRVIAPRLGKALGEPVSVINTPGADGMLGQEYYLKQPDGGYVLLVDSVTNTIQNVLIHNAPFKYDDFWMINLPARDFTLMATSADNDKIKSVYDVIAALKKDPTSLSVGVAPATPDYINLVLLADAAGIDLKKMRLVTEDSGPLRSAVLGGVIDVGLSGGDGFLPLASQIRPLLTFDAKRQAPYDAPAVSEMKFATPLAFVSGSLRGFVVSRAFKDKYPDRYAILVSTYEKVFKDPATIKVLEAQSLSSAWYGPEESNEVYRRTFGLMQKYAALLKGV